MSKISKSVSFEMAAFDKIKRIADRSFDHNFSKCLNWFIYSKMDEIEFNRFMAKYHNSEFQHFKAIVDELEAHKEVKPCTGTYPAIFGNVQTVDN